MSATMSGRACARGAVAAGEGAHRAPERGTRGPVLREYLLAPDVESVLTVGRTATGQRHARLREIVHTDLTDHTAIEGDLAGHDACLFWLYRVACAALWPLFPLLGALGLLTTTERVGRATLQVARRGAPKPILTNRDIDDLARLDTWRNVRANPHAFHTTTEQYNAACA